MIKGQQEIMISKYIELYALLVPKDNFLRQINELADFSFVYDELLSNYSLDQGRGAKDPLLMFKYLLLKVTFKLSDEDVVARSLNDLSFKYFLNLAPEDTQLIHPSSLTKFRKLSLKDMKLLDLLINKTVRIAINEGVFKSRILILDATHTKAKYNQNSAREELLERAKLLRKDVYAIDETLKVKMPKKVNSGILEDAIEYCNKLSKIVTSFEKVAIFPK